MVSVSSAPLYQDLRRAGSRTLASGEAFWASSLDAPNLVSAGMARPWQAGDPPAPPVEPAWTANGIPGFAAGTSNASH